MTVGKATTVAWVSLLLLSTTSRSFAVDRSKFRTCTQTSFCRRHRGQHSERLYKYKLEEESVHFHVPEHHDDAQKQLSEQEKHGGSGPFWKSWQQRILGSTTSRSGDGAGYSQDDPYVRGPPPTLSGTLRTTSSETSSGVPQESLLWSVHAMTDGIIRMRVTEVYGTHGAPYEKARVTYDDLVLTTDTLAPAKHAQWIRATADEDHKTLLTTLVSQLTNGSQDDNVENYMALQYGDAQDTDEGMILLIRMEDFAVFLYRQSDIEVGPIVTLGAHDMMHFEVRRLQQEESETLDAMDVKEPADAPDAPEDEGEKSEKEIVGYWEDGLAIYADGTREEKKEVAEEEAHRQLTESELAALDREGLWEESFQSHKDTKPHGPMSVGMDIVFPGSRHLFGLPEHASSTELKTTSGEGAYYTDPYRLYNLDVFEYELDETMALYGHVPLVVSQSTSTGTTGVFWFNPSETFVDVLAQEDESKATHWMSESGIVDVFLLPGPTPRSMYHQYARLTGTMPLPPMFSLGYHQCRWNYKDERDVYMVHDKFEELDYPYDVLWLDIEHTDGKRYFTWDENLFPHPTDMLDKLASQGRRMVTIIDPHIKRDDNYYIHKDATAKGLYVKDKDGKKDYDGWCWPGSSSYLDFTSEKVRSWWADQFSYDRYKGSTTSLFTWNDMNEPSVFNGPEVTMQKDLTNLNGEEHREWHNLYGMLFHQSTMEGQVRRNQPNEDVRPFVLSRAFFAGSQRYGAIWTGDNLAEWSHLEVASPMLLSLNVAALSFVGADVGGFFGNPDAELFTRWMQAGAYQPFFRGHAHHDSKRREPWTFGEDTMIRLRKAAMTRYALLPYWYSVFREAGVTGMPVMRTMWMQYPQIEKLYATDDQYLIGGDLLVKPVTGAGVTESTVLFPAADRWYDIETFQLVAKDGLADGVVERTLPSDIDKIPVFQRGGSVISRKLRLRRSARLMTSDPYTLYIALDKNKKALGRLYMDDEETFNHDRNSEFAEATFIVDLKTGTITNSVSIGSGWKSLPEDISNGKRVERIVVMGMAKPPSKAEIDGTPIGFDHDKGTSVLVLRRPDVSALTNWEIKLS